MPLGDAIDCAVQAAFTLTARRVDVAPKQSILAECRRMLDLLADNLEKEQLLLTAGKGQWVYPSNLGVLP